MTVFKDGKVQVIISKTFNRKKLFYMTILKPVWNSVLMFFFKSWQFIYLKPVTVDTSPSTPFLEQPNVPIRNNIQGVSARNIYFS